MRNIRRALRRFLALATRSIASLAGNVASVVAMILQMDHINGRGINERHLALSKRLALVKNEPRRARETFQLLCANCNSIKRVERQEYRRA